MQRIKSAAIWASSLAMVWLAASPLFAANAPDLKVVEEPISEATRKATSVAHVVDKVAPSVVKVYTTKIIKERLQQHPLFNDPLFREFFGPGRQGDREERERREQGLGSGVIVTSDGYILTNNHVVEGADEIKIGMPGRQQQFDAELVGTDPKSDVAVLKVDATGLPAVTMTDSDKIRVGDMVLAIGNPFNIGQTVSTGIVSAKGRGGFGLMDYEDFIQTDASINPGNSGGALVDAEGRLVGINTWIISSSRGSQGIGFAIPVNMARGIMKQLIETGEVRRGYLGVIIQSLDEGLVESLGLPNQSGALVSDVGPGTPAAEAGLKPGDVIIEVDGKKVADTRNLRLTVAQTPPNTETTLTVIRNGEEKEMEVTLGELPDEMTAWRGGQRSDPGQTETSALQGVEVTDLTQRARQQFNIPEEMQGALVTNVEAGSNAYRAGLRPGNVILEINKKPVRNAQDAVEMTREITGERVLLRIWSNGIVRYMVVNLGEQ